MEPAKARGPTTLLQKMQEVADRLSTHAKVEIYQVLEGVAPSGELSSLHRLDPLISDIVQQLSESFKQAFTKLLLPEASKLMGARAAASAPWAAGQALQTQGPDALTSASKEQTHLENDILALGLVPGTGQPLRPDQGPPQDAASAAASSLLLGTAATSSQTHMQHNLSPAPPTSVGGAGTSGGTAAASHPLESRFAFANDAHRSIPLSPLLGRDSSYGGGTVATIAKTDLGPVADSLHFLGLGESGTGMAFASGSETNGLANSFMLSASLTGSLGSGGGGIGGGRSTPGTGNGYTPAASPSPGTVSRQLGALSLGGTPVSRGGIGAVRTTASSVSPPSPNPSTPSPYQALPLTIRPGSSLDPGLATPPVSLSGTEPLRGNSHALHMQVSPQHHQQKNRLSGAGDASPLIPVGGSNDGGATRTVPVPLFGGAPGPSPAGPSHQHQQLRQQQPLPTGNGISGSVGEAGTRSSGNGGMAIGQQQQQQQLMQQQLQQQLHQQLQPQPQLMHQQHSNTDIGDYQRQQYALVQQQHLMQQQQSLTGQYDGSSFKPAPVLRTALASVPDGPRASYDGRTPSSSFAVSNPGEMPYGMQSIYCGNGANSISFQTAGAFGERFASPGPVAFGASGGGGITPGRSGFGGVGGSASPEYGMYSLAPLGPAGLGSGGGTGILMDMMRAGSSSGGGGAAASGLIQPGSGSAGATGIGYGNGAQSGNGRTGGSPIMTRAAPSTVTTATSGTVANRPSRSGTASATSAVDSRSSSFSTGAQMVPHRGSGNGGGTAMTQQPYGPQQPSPPASDASGPSSAASVSTVGIGAGGGVAKGSAVAALATTAASGGGDDGASCLSMAAKLQQVYLDAHTLIASKPVPSPVGSGRGKSGSSSSGGGSSGGGGPKAPADMPGRFRCLPPPVQARIHTLTRENHVVLLKDFDEKVLSKMTLLVDKFGAAECLAMLDRIEEVLKGKAGRLANGPGYLDVSVSTRLDELKQRASGQVTAPEDYARSTLHSRIYAELRDLISRHGFLQWHHFDQGIINMLKKMPNATALERLNELAYHSFKNVDNPKSCIVSIFTTKPKYVSGN